MPRKTVEQKLEELDALRSLDDLALKRASLEEALGDRHYRVVAKAARIAAGALAYDLAPALAQTFARWLDKPAKNDPSCFAKKALVRALLELDHDDAAIFRAGLRYRQPEPVWGGTADTAADVRASCAMGLVATGHPRALVEVAALLHDAEPDARLGAVRAVGCGQPREAELLLRGKALAGDTEPAVLGECFVQLLAIEPDESLEFVAARLAHGTGLERELAALALGESRLDGALAPLRAAWDEPLLPAGLRGALLRAVTMHRSEQAFAWLIELLEDRDVRIAADVLEALALYRDNAKLAARVRAAVEARDDDALAVRFRTLWREH